MKTKKGVCSFTAPFCFFNDSKNHLNDTKTV